MLYGAITGLGATEPQPDDSNASGCCPRPDHTCREQPQGDVFVGSVAASLGLYLDVAVQTDSTAVWNLEFLVKAHLQVISLVCYDLPGAFYIGWEVLGIIWRLDGSHIGVNGTTTAW